MTQKSVAKTYDIFYRAILLCVTQIEVAATDTKLTNITRILKLHLTRASLKAYYILQLAASVFFPRKTFLVYLKTAEGLPNYRQEVTRTARSRQEQKIADKKHCYVIFSFKCCLNSVLYV